MASGISEDVESSDKITTSKSNWGTNWINRCRHYNISQ